MMNEMGITEFVLDLFYACPVEPERLDLETAAYDLENMRRCDYNVPDDMTADDFVREWNDLVYEQNPEKFYWYAIVRDNDDRDWGTGSYDLGESIKKAIDLRNDGYPDAHIVIVDVHRDDPFCVDEIFDLDEV